MAIRTLKKGFQADVTVTVDGEPRRQRVTFATYKEAREGERAIREALEAGETYCVPGDIPKERTNKYLLRNIVEETNNRYWRDAKSGKGLYSNGRNVVEILGENTDIREINRRSVDKLIDTCKARNNSNGTINRKLAALSKMLKFAYDREMITTRPDVEYLKERKGRIRYLSDAEETGFLDYFEHTAKEVHRDIFIALLDTGCRTGELWKLQPNDMRDGLVSFWDTKSGKSRSVPLTARASASFERLLPLIESRQVSYRSFHAHFTMARQHLGYTSDIIPHTLRHTCCTRLVQNGIDLRTVMTWMGHENIVTTMRYAHLAPQNLRAARDLLEKLKRSY